MIEPGCVVEFPDGKQGKVREFGKVGWVVEMFRHAGKRLVREVDGVELKLVWNADGTKHGKPKRYRCEPSA